MPANRRVVAAAAGGASIQSAVPAGRITLTSGVPVTTVDVSTVGSIFYEPYVHDKIALFDGSDWKELTFSGTSLVVSGETPSFPYDVFAFDSGGTFALELGPAWTDQTIRSAAVSQQDGIFVRTSDPTRRLLGTIRLNSSSLVSESLTIRNVSNLYNQVIRKMFRGESTATWDYTTDTFRIANNNGANLLEVTTVFADFPVRAWVTAQFFNTTDTGVRAGSGIGIANNTTNEADTTMSAGSAIANSTRHTGMAEITDARDGFRSFRWLEKSNATGTTRWYGTDADRSRSGIYATVMG